MHDHLHIVLHVNVEKLEMAITREDKIAYICTKPIEKPIDKPIDKPYFIFMLNLKKP